MAENNYYTTAIENGTINISEEVIVALVKNAVEDSDGAALSNTAGAELAELLNLRSSAKGVKVQFADDVITIDVVITVLYGKNIVETAQHIQENIMNEMATLPKCKSAVNVHVSGITFAK